MFGFQSISIPMRRSKTFPSLMGGVTVLLAFHGSKLCLNPCIVLIRGPGPYRASSIGWS